MRSCVYYATHILLSWSEELKKKFQLREIGQIGTLQENMVMYFFLLLLSNYNFSSQFTLFYVLSEILSQLSSNCVGTWES